MACALFYLITPRFGTSAGLFLLLILSLLFYWTWGTTYLCLLILSFTANFAVACTVLLTGLRTSRPIRRLWLFLGQRSIISAHFSGSNIGCSFSFSREPNTPIPCLTPPFPPEISFYTFQQAIFLVDAYHRDASVVAYLGDMRTTLGKLKGYLRHSFFVAFFAHLLIGPIVYLKEFQPQIASRQFGRVRRTDLEAGAALVIIGLFKKLVIADHLAPISDRGLRTLPMRYSCTDKFPRVPLGRRHWPTTRSCTSISPDTPISPLAAHACWECGFRSTFSRRSRRSASSIFTAVGI